MNLSTKEIRELYSTSTAYIPVVLLTITHPTFDEPIRISTDNKDVMEQNIFKENLYGTISRGNNYYFLPFSFELPSSHTDEAPTASLTITNVGLDLIPYIRNLQARDKPKILIEVIIAQEPDNVIQAFPELTIGSISYDAQSINFTLESVDLSREPFPSGTFNPTFFKGMFKGL